MKLEHFQIMRRDKSKPNVVWAKCVRCDDKRGHVEIDTMRLLWHCKRCWRGGLLDGHPQHVAAPERPPLDAAQFEQPIEHGGVHHRFLVRRGFSERVIRELDPRYGPEPSMVYFPVMDGYGRTVYFVGRYIFSETEKRWWFSPSAPGKSSCLWGLHRATGLKEIILVEGVFDAVWHPNRLAVFGTRISKSQINILSSMNLRRITIALDPDAMDKAINMAATLAQSITTRIHLWEPKDDRDPSDLGETGSELIRTNSRRFM